MPAVVRAASFDRSVGLVLDRALSPALKGKLAADAARKILAEAQEANRRVLGRVPDHETIVDSRKGAPLESVNTNGGHIVFRFDIAFEQVLIWIDQQLIRHSPVKTGSYQRSHKLYADLKEIDVDGSIPQASEYLFISSLPYSRKIERGQSPQAPDGVYEAVAMLAQRRFADYALIGFSWHSPILNYMSGASNREQRAVMRNGAFSQLQAARDKERSTRFPAIQIYRPKG